MTLVRRREILDSGKLFLAAERCEESRDFRNAFKSLLAGALLGRTSCELAKICKARKGGQKAALALLRRALKMNRNYITENGREEAGISTKRISCNASITGKQLSR
jgi:hypothetical protein